LTINNSESKNNSVIKNPSASPTIITTTRSNSSPCLNTRNQAQKEKHRIFLVDANNNQNNKNIKKMSSSTTNAQANESSPNSNDQNTNPRKDHYSYSYKYKTAADPESGVPGVNTVEVNESVTEEIGPDGTKIIRRHQQEKQINKITQVVTQRVIKRQYIDPSTGQIIEYDPNNELFANLPPETVFEEHTIISDDNSGNPPIITTTTLSKTAPNAAATTVTNTNTSLINKFNQFGINDSSKDYADNINNNSKQNIYSTVKISNNNSNLLNDVNVVQNVVSSMKIKSHPEDNQGYPEERNMDFDPDDSYNDDDSPYEGLIPPQQQQHHHNNNDQRNSGADQYDNEFDDEELQRQQQKHQNQQLRQRRREIELIERQQNSVLMTGHSQHHHLHHHSGGSSTGSSSPILYDPNIDMPQVSSANVYQKSSSVRVSSKYANNDGINGGMYATVLPSSNINNSNLTPRSNNGSQHYQTINKHHQQLSVDCPYGFNQQQQQHQQQQQLSQNSYTRHQQHVQIQNHHEQQASPSIHCNEYGKYKYEHKHFFL
jgi:hypothetical protein